jgi:hypothetical protein
MKKPMLTCAAAVPVSTGAMVQSTVVTTTGTGHAAAVQVEPEFRTKIRTCVTKIGPVQTREKIVAGAPAPREVELRTVLSDGGPPKYRYVYSGERVMLVDPLTRTVVQETECFEAGR